MKKATLVALTLACMFGFSRFTTAADDAAKYWPQWRGPLSTGVAPQADPPITWSEDENIKWKFKFPGTGNSSPIVWGDRVFLLSAVKTDRPAEKKEEKEEPAESEGNSSRGGRRGGGFMDRMLGEEPTVYYRFEVLCLDRATGKVLWQRTAREEVPHQRHHRDGDYASFSPVTDGKHLIVDFGSRGLHCYDFQGNRLWEKDLGKLDIVVQFGEGGSPALHGDTILINRDHQGQSFLIAVDKKTGETIWRTEREEVTSWSTPLVLEHDGKTQVVVSATGRIRGYDIATGEVLWECGGLGRNVIPTPVTGCGMVFAMSGFRGSAFRAIELGHDGDLTDSDAVRWQLERGTPYVPSPLLYGTSLYFCESNKAVLSCHDAESGDPHFSRERIEDLRSIYASPVGAADRVYLVGRNGTATVIKRSAELEVLATNTLEDRFDASPALVGKEIFLRGKENLYCITAE